MKVMCIDATVINDDAIYPKEGEIVTASQCPVCKDNYDISEYPIGKDGRLQSLRKHRFIPLSNIDETELVKERESELVNQ